MVTSKLWLYGLLTRWIPETRCFGLKAALLRWCGATVGKNVRISSSAKFFGGGVLVIGDDVWIGSGDMIHPVSRGRIKIGNCCDLGPEVVILTGSHKIDPVGTHIAGEGTYADVEIGDGCWLGARSLILPGVILPRKTLVAADAILRYNFPMQVPCDHWGRWVKQGLLELYHVLPACISQNQARFGTSTQPNAKLVSSYTHVKWICHKSKRLIGKAIDEMLMRMRV